MDSPEVKATKALDRTITRAKDDLVRTLNTLTVQLKKLEPAIAALPVNKSEEVAPAPTDDSPGTKLPAYGTDWDRSVAVDEWTSNGFGKITEDGVTIHLPAPLYTKMHQAILDHGGPTGFLVTILHDQPVTNG